MNQLVVKRAVVFSSIFGAVLGLCALVPAIIGYVGFILVFCSSIIIILYMKKNEKHLGIIDTQQGAILGAVVGFFTTVGFFSVFSPMVCIIKMFFKSYYDYAIPGMFATGIWLFFVVVFMVGVMFAMTNAASGMALAWVLGYVEKKPADEAIGNLDIKIED